MTETNQEYRSPERIKGTILERIALAKAEELQEAKIKHPLDGLKTALVSAPAVRGFKKALENRFPAIIAEIKKASPSAGLICKDFDPLGIIREYEKGGAAAVSVITEKRHFQGDLAILAELRRNSSMALLRKDFIIDPYQIYEARNAGADAVLLIAMLLSASDLRQFRIVAERIGMDALVETHNEAELEQALESGASIIGVNSRDLRTFEVDMTVAMTLGRKIPSGVFAVAESGIKSAADIRRLAGAGFKGFLVGEQFMRAPSPGAALAELIEGVNAT
jgi:indole-3-glycerol phosphate synthase